MPSVSPAQHRMMEIAAHTTGGYGGVPQKVGKEYAVADAAKKRPTVRKSIEDAKKEIAARTQPLAAV